MRLCFVCCVIILFKQGIITEVRFRPAAEASRQGRDRREQHPAALSEKLNCFFIFTFIYAAGLPPIGLRRLPQLTKAACRC